MYYYSKLTYKKDLQKTLQEGWPISTEFITVRSSYISKVGTQNFVKKQYLELYSFTTNLDSYGQRGGHLTVQTLLFKVANVKSAKRSILIKCLKMGKSCDSYK